MSRSRTSFSSARLISWECVAGHYALLAGGHRPRLGRQLPSWSVIHVRKISQDLHSSRPSPGHVESVKISPANCRCSPRLPSSDGNGRKFPKRSGRPGCPADPAEQCACRLERVGNIVEGRRRRQTAVRNLADGLCKPTAVTIAASIDSHAITAMRHAAAWTGVIRPAISTGAHSAVAYVISR